LLAIRNAVRANRIHHWYPGVSSADDGFAGVHGARGERGFNEFARRTTLVARDSTLLLRSRHELRRRQHTLQVPVAVLWSINANLRGHFGHRRPIEPTDLAALKPMTELRLLAPLEEQIRLVAFRPHV